MNAPDIRVSTTLPRHRKFKRFKRLVGPEAMELLVNFWCEVAEQAPTGDLAGWSNEDIADTAGWEGNPDEFVSALMAGPWVDGEPGELKVHDWEEHQEYVVKAPERIAKAKKAARKRWECNEHAPSMPKEMPPSPPFPSLPNQTKEKKTNGAPRLSCPDDVSETVWTDFLAHRKAKKSAVTQTAMNRIRSQAEKAGWTFEDALAEICSRGWQGFKAEWVTKKESSYDNIPLITEDDL